MSFTEPRLCFFVRMVFFNEGTDLIQDNSFIFLIKWEERYRMYHIGASTKSKKSNYLLRKTKVKAIFALLHKVFNKSASEYVNACSMLTFTV